MLLFVTLNKSYAKFPALCNPEQMTQGMNKTAKQTNHGWGTDILVLTFAFGLLFFTLLGSRPLFVPDEGRYAEIAREMVARGDYITPYLNGIKYFEKPVLFYWLGALAIKFGGASVTAVRCINAFIALLGCLITYASGRLLYGRATGLIASIVLATSTLYFIMAHMVSLDLPVSGFIAASLYGFLLSTQAQTPTARRYYLYGAAVAAALAVLTKGLIGLVFPGMIITVWMLALNEWRQLQRLPIISAAFIFFLIAAPWHIVVNHYNPEFFHFYFIEQHFLRYTTMDVGHYQPAWFFIPTLIGGFFPWIVFLPQVITTSLPRQWSQRNKYASELFFVLWAALIFAFFSFSKSKLIPYILPVVPALAMLTGRYLSTRLSTVTRGLLAGYSCLVLMSAGMVFFLWNLNITVSNPANATLFLRIALIPLFLGSLISMVVVSRSPRTALYLITVSTALFLVFSLGAVRFIDSRTIRPLAATLRPLLQTGDDVITYNQYYQDLPFYLERRVTILNWRNELSYGMEHQNTDDWMIDNKKFWSRWQSKQRVYMIMSREEYQRFHERYPHEKIVLIEETPNNVLVSNLPLVLPPT
jgi:4-amino-4-deoxy-L-arabinose transferase-like glycosyltransferase